MAQDRGQIVTAQIRITGQREVSQAVGCMISGLLKYSINSKVRNFKLKHVGNYPFYILSMILIPMLQLDGDLHRVRLSTIMLTGFDIAGDLINVLVIHGGMFGMGMKTSILIYIPSATTVYGN